MAIEWQNHKWDSGSITHTAILGSIWMQIRHGGVMGNNFRLTYQFDGREHLIAMESKTAAKAKGEAVQLVKTKLRAALDELEQSQ